MKTKVFPTFVFVVDTTIEQAELNVLKEQLLKVIDTIPKASHVGLVTIGANVYASNDYITNMTG